MNEEINELIKEISTFTYTSYNKLLDYLQEKYSIIPFSRLDYIKKKPYLILRHDIDASPIYAVKMAEVEKSKNIQSTYFVLLSNKHYNIFHPENFNALITILNLGHEIGVHYDLSVFDQYLTDYSQILDTEIKILENLFKTSITSISIHNPSINQNYDPFEQSNNYINAYDEKNFDLYVSDSCRAWYLEDLCKLLTRKIGKTQLSIHPFLWTDKHVPRDKILDKFFENISTQNIRDKKDWITLWSSNEKVIEYEKKLKEL